ncbi:MAG: hypothetical protein US68_C0022G0005 [Candidatus Shapirobacteria bacterium GW2011_GWE1_38_10]|uniref:Uncharacterized protein n=1 Tax=Candidatus Shapirobacteria bacterium GW2011_GWE1_38_10 TaxID=1618488 RepID=A0A0G0ID23_9BACT|nr:MAG: hypothetical protein US68_C0022G0005 [Candidatus Shapirobacteria bacterium GW2011_GWE1_38_10]
MKLIELSVKNYRSIKQIDTVKISSLQILLGENNSGKSNTLLSIESFLTAGAGGITEVDFQDKSSPIIIRAKFSISSQHLKKSWRPYMINDELILEKHVWIENVDGTKISIKNEYHGYQAEPKEWYLSVNKIRENRGDRPKWKEIVSENNLPDYFLNEGNCNKEDFVKGVEKYLFENEVEFDDPDVSKTQALGFQSKAISNLPRFYYLRAETTYSDETDKRSSTSTFRRLMADLTDRIIKKDPKYIKIEEALNTVKSLLNETEVESGDNRRLESLSTIEEKIKDILCNLMPSVKKVKLRVETEDVTTIFSKGVEITIDDGFDTNVLLKGHGLQRCVIFSLLQALILNDRDELVESGESDPQPRNPIILGIEEPELFIHPQIGKLFYDVLNSFSEKDQVIYTTHSPRFIDVYKYDSIALVKKENEDGTIITNCNLNAFDGLFDKQVFMGMTQLNSDVNELFFAKNVLLVEGSEDKIAITETLKKTGKINLRTEEIGITIIVTGGKQAIPFFVRVLNAFNISYSVLHDLDITDGMQADDKATEEKRNQEIQNLANGKITTFPVKLETTLGLEKGHFKDQYDALKFFQDHNNINVELEKTVTASIKSIE